MLTEDWIVSATFSAHVHQEQGGREPESCGRGEGRAWDPHRRCGLLAGSGGAALLS